MTVHRPFRYGCSAYRLYQTQLKTGRYESVRCAISFGSRTLEGVGFQLCLVLPVLGEARSSFYHAAAPTAMQVADAGVGDLIEAVFRCHRRRYGYRRLAEDLSDRGVTCAPARIRRLMAQRGLHAIQPKTFVPKTSLHAHHERSRYYSTARRPQRSAACPRYPVRTCRHCAWAFLLSPSGSSEVRR